MARGIDCPLPLGAWSGVSPHRERSVCQQVLPAWIPLHVHVFLLSPDMKSGHLALVPNRFMFVIILGSRHFWMQYIVYNLWRFAGRSFLR